MAERRTTPAVDVYLFPAPLGGGRGDVDEVFVAGQVLAGTGVRVRLFRLQGRPWPSAIADPRDWPPFPRVSRLGSRRPWALTVSAAWGVTCAPRRPGPLGRAGPWALESTAVEESYGPERTIHLSFEEFARTLTSREQTIERYREGGWSRRAILRRARLRGFRQEVQRFRTAYRRFRGFDQRNVLSIFPGLERSPRFQNEFGEAVQTGPLWPRRFRPGHSDPRPVWVWYADSPSTARLAPSILEGLQRSGRRVRLDIRGSPDAVGALVPSAGWSLVPKRSPRAWGDRFENAELRIVTGSRSLLEALEVGGPFLYFNGVTGSGSSTRRHRPEKLTQLLRALASQRVPRRVLRDLREFSLARRVAQVCEAAASRSWQRSFPRGTEVRGYSPPFDSANSLLVELVHQVHLSPEGPGGSSARIVEELRRRSVGTAGPARSHIYKGRAPIPG
ncbi:MAG: hypothetical protein L3K19_05565 [Thermoplasmata archaeon]|nr:hypothetical protein [Thermoplasmata archaeon]